MKYLSSLTSFFVTLLFVAYLGVLSGQQINGVISKYKIVEAAQPAPAIILTQTPSPSPSSRPVLQTSISTPANTPPPQQEQQAPIPQPTPEPTEQPTPTPITQEPGEPEPTPQPTPDNRCIITISGSMYDVTEYRNIHSGGNVFQCGSDMTAIFLSQHSDSYLGRMSQYKL